MSLFNIIFEVPVRRNLRRISRIHRFTDSAKASRIILDPRGIIAQFPAIESLSPRIHTYFIFEHLHSQLSHPRQTSALLDQILIMMFHTFLLSIIVTTASAVEFKLALWGDLVCLSVPLKGILFWICLPFWSNL